ncbi:hypothetical protein CHARACLAT_021074 [Characodon lateralis]|uniref:Uncharacterized protein n=1 Tax=Characodon lateralis TaxID=208331 RepID=A0ABU7EKX9_9TELE|nr:hypothetical protein [Characodon lateralis]
MDPEARDPGTYHSPSRGTTEPRGPGTSKQFAREEQRRAPVKPPCSHSAEAPGMSSNKPTGPTGVSWHTPKHPTPDTDNHQHTSGKRQQPTAGSAPKRK